MRNSVDIAPLWGRMNAAMNTSVNYIPRVADEALPFRLSACGALVIAGAKWCGKSTTAARYANTIVELQDSGTNQQNIELAKTYPSRFLDKPTPMLIDEWQIVPSLWDAIRNTVDKRGEFGQFLLAGSSVPPDKKKILHSGAGRFSTFTMRPMSLWESGESNGAVSLRDLFDGNSDIYGENQTDLDQYAYAICRGGWPLTVRQSPRVALRLVRDFYTTLVNSDMSRYDGVKRSPARVRLLMRAYARAISTFTKYSTMILDMRENDAGRIDRATIADYIDALKGLYIIEDLPTWNPDFRARTTLRMTDKRHFVDPSICCAALSLTPERLLEDLHGMGLLFESLAVRDLRVYAEALEGEVFQYHDANGLEADAVMQLFDGRYALFEVKMSSSEHIEEGARTLKKIVERIDVERMGRKPSFLAVLTTTSVAYRRPDGVLVLPLATLRA